MQQETFAKQGPKSCQFHGKNFHELKIKDILCERRFHESSLQENLLKKSEHIKNQRTFYMFTFFNFQKWVREIIRTFQIDNAVSQFCFT